MTPPPVKPETTNHFEVLWDTVATIEITADPRRYAAARSRARPSQYGRNRYAFRFIGERSPEIPDRRLPAFQKAHEVCVVVFEVFASHELNHPTPTIELQRRYKLQSALDVPLSPLALV